MLEHTCKLSPPEGEQENGEFKDSLGYMNSLRQARSTQWDLTYKRPEEGRERDGDEENEAGGTEGKGGRRGEREPGARDTNVLSLLQDVQLPAPSTKHPIASGA